jgi:hypothetical protein
VHRKLDADEQDTSEPPQPQWRGADGQSARRSSHACIEKGPTARPYQQSHKRLGQATLWESGSNSVQERELDVVLAEGEPHGQSRHGKEQLEVASLEGEHHAYDGGKHHVSRQRAMKRLFELHAA